MSKLRILGVPLDILTPVELERSLRQLLYRRRSQIVTPNPEFLLLAQKNQEFFSVLERATLSIPDGIGLKFAGWLKGHNLYRYSGSNLLLYLLRLADQKHLRVAVINWRGGLSSDENIIQAVKKRHPHLKCFVFSMEKNGVGYEQERLRKFRPDIIFTALGAPEQDVFIRQRLLRDIFSVRLAMGVGGSFDFLTGKAKRAPRFMQLVGLEWFWRLILQPWRIKRIWNAVVIFPLVVIRWQFRRFLFRTNVVGMIVNQFNEVLILNRRGNYDYWGLPQGGVEARETKEAAIAREIYEETSLRNLGFLGYYEDIFSYIWPKHYTNSGYKGQRQSLFILAYNGPRAAVRLDRAEHKAYRWVPLTDFIRSVSPIHRKNYQIFLNKYYEIIGQKN